MTIGDQVQKMVVVSHWPRFVIQKCSASVDSCETKIRETKSTLNYITPHFRAEAEVEISAVNSGEEYTIGWVQAVTHMKFYNSYPDGQSSWEIQELNSGETMAVSDADGRQYPWYGVTTECVRVRGPCPNTRVRILMNDNFSPTVSWAAPVGKDQPDTLQGIHRDQSFVAWLIVKNESTGEILPLKSYRWRAVINVGVDCSRKIGDRAKVLEPKLQAQPIEQFDLRIPKQALTAPRANEAQKFVWRTSDAELIFEVQCMSSLTPSLQPPSTNVRYSCRYTPY